MTYGQHLTDEVVVERLIRALERQVLTVHNPELRGYFELVAQECTSAMGEDDGISGASDVDLEQVALLLCHHDRDGDGKLSPEEFSALIELTFSQTGISYGSEHVAKVFHEADVDSSGFVDLNELLLLRRRPQRR